MDDAVAYYKEKLSNELWQRILSALDICMTSKHMRQQFYWSRRSVNVTVGKFIGLNGKEIEQVLSHLNLVQSMCLARRFRLCTASFFQFIREHMGGSIIVLDLSECAMQAGTIEALCQALPHLEKLSLRENYTLTNEGVQNLRNMKSLQTLNLSRNGRIKDFSCVEGLISLKHISFFGNMHLATNSLHYLGTLTNLEYLDLRSVDTLTGHLHTLAPLKRLHTLRIDCTVCDNEELLSMLGELPSLKQITCKYACSEGTLDSMAQLYPHLDNVLVVSEDWEMFEQWERIVQNSAKPV